VSRTANDERSQEAEGWSQARNQLFQMIMEGRSFSGRERNCFFLNTGRQQFATISAISGLDHNDDARCIAVTDWDGDGAEDLWVSNRTAPRLRLMRNTGNSKYGNSKHHFVSVRLQGNGKTTNRDAIGARVELILTDPQFESRRLVETLQAGEGFLSQSTKWLHFGLGETNEIKQVRVNWPNGETETFGNLQVDNRFLLVQGTRDAVPQETPSGSQLAAGEQRLPKETRAARIRLQSPIPMPSVRYSNDASSFTERFDQRTTKLVTLWASWCAPCVEELVDLTEHATHFENAKLQVLSLCVDRCGKQSSSSNDAQTLLDNVRFPHAWGHIDDEQMSQLQQLHNQLFFLRRPLPLPSSFLIDAQGRLAAIYRGPITTEQVLSDLQSPQSTNYVESLEHSACLPGRAIDHPRTEHVAASGQKQAQYLIASWLRDVGQTEDAVEHFEQLSESAPNWAPPLRQLARLHLQRQSPQKAFRFAKQAIAADPKESRAHNTLGLIYAQQKLPHEALNHFRLATELDPEFAEAHNNLGSELASKGDIPTATRHFAKAVKLDDDFAEAHTNLGSAFAAQKQIPAAIKQYQKAIQVDPNYVDAHNNLGTMLGGQGKLQDAIRCYERAVAIAPHRSDIRRNLQQAINLLKARTVP